MPQSGRKNLNNIELLVPASYVYPIPAILSIVLWPLPEENLLGEDSRIELPLFCYGDKNIAILPSDCGTYFVSSPVSPVI
jgi:hypothetical protein